MRRITILIAFAIIIGAALPVTGQRALDQDYFTANESPSLKNLLNSVDFNHTNKAMGFILKGQAHYAIQDLKYTLDTFPNHPRALQLMAVAAKQRKSPSLAIPFYEKALRLYPKYALTHAQYGEYLVDIGRVDEGIEKLKDAIGIDGNLAPAYDWLSKAYTKTGDLEMARQTAEKAKELGLKDVK